MLQRWLGWENLVFPCSKSMNTLELSITAVTAEREVGLPMPIQLNFACDVRGTIPSRTHRRSYAMNLQLSVHVALEREGWDQQDSS